MYSFIALLEIWYIQKKKSLKKLTIVNLKLHLVSVFSGNWNLVDLNFENSSFFDLPEDTGVENKTPWAISSNDWDLKEKLIIY